MILRLGGHLSFYAPQKASELELEIPARIPLAELLQRLQVPADEVALVVINGEQAELTDAFISDQDLVHCFPANRTPSFGLADLCFLGCEKIAWR